MGERAATRAGAASPGSGTAPAGAGRPSVLERVLVAVLLATFATLAVLSMRAKSPTFDETAHLAAGISYVQLGDHRMNPEHPVLPKLLAGAAASATGVKVPADSPAWVRGEQWDFAREVLYESGVDWRRILFAGRLPMVALGVLLGLVVWLWTRAMVGPGGAAFALALYSFSPNILAHTRLVTTDVPLTLTVVAACACLWKAWSTGRLSWAVAGAACVGLSMVTKFSAFSYAPVYVLLLLLPSPRRPIRGALLHLAVFAGCAAVFTELAVFASYGFQWDGVSIRSLGMAGRGVRPEDMSLLRRLPYEVMARIPWPSSDFARGLKTIILYTEAGHPVYLMGMRGDHGWWWSPLVMLAVKTPIPLLLLGVAAAWRTVRSRSLRRLDLLFLVAPIVLVLATNVAANLGLGVRHLLPMFPFAMIFAAVSFLPGPGEGGLVAGSRRRRIELGLVAIALAWHATGTLRAHPHYLAFFNEIAGGARGGYRWLGDSNLDWGQDLSSAAARLRARGVTGAILCYFGTASPFAEGIDWQLLPPAARGKDRDPWVVLPGEGEQWLVMSATNRQGIYYRVPGGGPPYPWLDDVEPEEIVGGTIFLYEIGRNADVQKGLAATYRRHGMQEEEEKALERVHAERIYDSEARQRLTALYLAKGEKDKAATLILTSPNPAVSEILQVAKIREEQGDLVATRDIYERGMRGFPGDPDLKNGLAWFLQEYEIDLDLALDLATKAIEWSDELYYRDTRAMVRLKRGEVEEALKDLDVALGMPGGDLAEIRWHRAQALRAAGRTREAEEEARRVLERDDVPEELYFRIEEWFSGERP